MKTTLTNVKINHNAVVIDLECNNQDKKKFLNLGIAKGTKIKPVFKSPFGDPTAYEIKKAIFALREEDAKKIKVSIEK